MCVPVDLHTHAHVWTYTHTPPNNIIFITNKEGQITIANCAWSWVSHFPAILWHNLGREVPQRILHCGCHLSQNPCWVKGREPVLWCAPACLKDAMTRMEAKNQGFFFIRDADFFIKAQLAAFPIAQGSAKTSPPTWSLALEGPSEFLRSCLECNPRPDSKPVVLNLWVSTSWSFHGVCLRR